MDVATIVGIAYTVGALASGAFWMGIFIAGTGSTSPSKMLGLPVMCLFWPLTWLVLAGYAVATRTP